MESLLRVQVSLVQVAALYAYHHPTLCALVLPLLPQGCAAGKCGIKYHTKEEN